MKIGVWNIRGMNKLLKQSEVISVFNKSRLDIMGIVETRIRNKNALSIQRRKFKQFFILDNYSSHLNGRIWIIWKDSSLNVQVLNTSSQWIHLSLTHGSHVVEATFVYGFNHPAQRFPLWDFLVSNVGCTNPWIVLGDVNCVRTTEERISSDPPNAAAMAEFNEAIANAGLAEVRTQGCCFTWTNKQDYADRKWVRLDRALVNTSWLLAFPDSYAEALICRISTTPPGHYS
ncbi:uncharacterized protein LOC141641620 [Silene latifolia]|uniref:uncharacterized protein LOC141641620 n=1 Tax=Silene latifolia TaxID=37657 RepID=UPI003D78A80D